MSYVLQLLAAYWWIAALILLLCLSSLRRLQNWISNPKNLATDALGWFHGTADALMFLTAPVAGFLAGLWLFVNLGIIAYRVWHGPGLAVRMISLAVLIPGTIFGFKCLTFWQSTDQSKWPQALARFPVRKWKDPARVWIVCSFVLWLFWPRVLWIARWAMLPLLAAPALFIGLCEKSQEKSEAVALTAGSQAMRPVPRWQAWLFLATVPILLVWMAGDSIYSHSREWLLIQPPSWWTEDSQLPKYRDWEISSKHSSHEKCLRILQESKEGSLAADMAYHGLCMAANDRRAPSDPENNLIPPGVGSNDDDD